MEFFLNDKPVNTYTFNFSFRHKLGVTLRDFSSTKNILHKFGIPELEEAELIEGKYSDGEPLTDEDLKLFSKKYPTLKVLWCFNSHAHNHIEYLKDL